jgi:flagellar biosynthetic protein FliQ
MLPEALFRQGLMMLLLVGGPLLGALLVSGLLIGALQATTQVNDPAVGFLPRLCIALGVCWFGGSWMIERLAGYLVVALQQIASN